MKEKPFLNFSVGGGGQGREEGGRGDGWKKKLPLKKIALVLVIERR